MLSGCPCGCMTKLPWFNDPDCLRNKPSRVPEGWDQILAELHSYPGSDLPGNLAEVSAPATGFEHLDETA
jgi:hypothetical protein